VYLITHFIV